MKSKQLFRIGVLFFLVIMIVPDLSAQKDSTRHVIDSFLLKRKGLIGKLSQSIIANQPISTDIPIRTDILLEKYKGKIIRNIFIKRIGFGIPITDTNKHLQNWLTNVANDLHSMTKEQVIRNNLFFKKGDKLVPLKLADNEKHLRDLNYLRDVSINVINAGKDSVDILVLTKDVLSLGAGFHLDNETTAGLDLSEDNFGGWGHALSLQTLYDKPRRPNFAYNAVYTGRNIGGSFIDWNVGYYSFNSTINTGSREEESAFTGFVRPLVSSYTKFTYGGQLATHKTIDAYSTDTLYTSRHMYNFYNYDAWIGWNTETFRKWIGNKDDRLRTLIGLRYVQQSFSQRPTFYKNRYYYLYADWKAALASITIFRQDFYKTKFVYGFGINEDIPEGLDFSLTGGWSIKSGERRPYIGLDLQRYYFTSGEDYFKYTLKADGYFFNKKPEDMNLLFDIDYISRLMSLGSKWKQRDFVNFSFTRQVNRVLNEPLFLESDYGLPEWSTDTTILGNTRMTLKAESVFFTPWNIAYFHFAPFVFGNFCMFNPDDRKFYEDNVYKSIGLGLRTRNESLIFNTIELRAYYFPQKDFHNKSWLFQLNINVRFKYNQQFIKKPDIVSVNQM